MNEVIVTYCMVLKYHDLALCGTTKIFIDLCCQDTAVSRVDKNHGLKKK